MDAKDAYLALKAWRSLPAAARSEVVDLAKEGRPSPDPQVARQAIDWARGEAPLTYISTFVSFFLFALVQVVARLPLGFAITLSLMALVGLMMFLTIAWERRSHEGAAHVAQLNLTARVAAGDYPARVALIVHAAGRPSWFIEAIALSAGLWLSPAVLGMDVSSAPSPSRERWWFAAIFMVVVAVILTPLLTRLSRRPVHFAGAGSVLLGLGPQGLRISLPDRPFVAWTDVTSAQPTLTDISVMGKLTMTFVLQNPYRVVDVPVHWFDEDPGVVLATAKLYIATAPPRLITPVVPVTPKAPRTPLPVPAVSPAPPEPPTPPAPPTTSVRRAHPDDLD